VQFPFLPKGIYEARVQDEKFTVQVRSDVDLSFPL
jgi:hypothetical protein